VQTLESCNQGPSSAAGPSLLQDDSSNARRRQRERHRKLGRALRTAVLGLGIAGASVAAVWALRPSPVPVDVARVTRGPLEVDVDETGTSRVKDRYVVSMPLAGRVSRLDFEVGDPIQEGQVLVEIAPSLSPLLDARAHAESEARLGAALSAQGQAEAQRARALAGAEQAEREQARLEALARSGSVAEREREQAEFAQRMRKEELASAVFAAKVAAEEVRAAREVLGDGEHSRARHADVVSPVSGKILRVQQKSAATLQAGAPLVEVGDPAVLEVVVDLLTTDAVRVTPGTPATIEAWGGAPVAGRVRRVEPSAFTKPSALGVDEQRVNVIISLTDPRERWASLGDGYRVEARLVLWQAPDVVKVPHGAAFRHGDGWAVFRVDRGVARLVSVQVGHRGETEMEILSGLAPGDEVAIHPGDRVKEGARVEAR